MSFAPVACPANYISWIMIGGIRGLSDSKIVDRLSNKSTVVGIFVNKRNRSEIRSKLQSPASFKMAQVQ